MFIIAYVFIYALYVFDSVIHKGKKNADWFMKYIV